MKNKMKNTFHYRVEKAPNTLKELRRGEQITREKSKIHCPFGHIQKTRKGYAIVPNDLHVNVCETCGVLFDGRITIKMSNSGKDSKR